MREELKEALLKSITIDEVLSDDETYIIVRGNLLTSADEAFKNINEALAPSQLCAYFRKFKDKVEIRITGKPKVSKIKPTKYIVLFLITLITTSLAGSLLSGKGDIFHPSTWVYGLPFAFSLLLILGSHESGHYFACKSRGISATPPFFIPVPPPFPLGTLGAVIKIKSPIKNRNELVLVGAMGPIIGFIVSIPVVIIGLILSQFKEIREAGSGIPLGNSIIFKLLTDLITKPPGPNYDLYLHPVAFAGWVGLFVTSINLLPIGQLDGGHIGYALLGEKFKYVATIFIIITLGMGMMGILGLIRIFDFGRRFWPGWFFWGAIILMIGIYHPPPMNELSKLSKKYKILGIIGIIIFILTFMTSPFPQR